jgi:hypothetical protein
MPESKLRGYMVDSQSRQSYAIIEIIVESAAIYAIAGVVYLPFIFKSNTSINNLEVLGQYIDVFFANAVVSEMKYVSYHL